MNLSMNLPSAAKWVAVSAITLLAACAAFAQEDRPHVSPALAGGTFIVFLFFAAAMYVYIALAVKTIAEKTNTENTWLAWIPIANFVLLLNIARKPIWWIVLLLIPLVNIIIIVMIWMAVAEARSKPSGWGVLMLVPGVSFIVPGYLAWSD